MSLKIFKEFIHYLKDFEKLGGPLFKMQKFFLYSCNAVEGQYVFVYIF